MFLLVPAYPGSPGQRPLNGCVCVCVLTVSGYCASDSLQDAARYHCETRYTQCAKNPGVR